MDSEFANEMKWYASLGDLEQVTYDEITDTGMPHDYINEWMPCDLFNETNISRLRPVKTYEEYVAASNWKQEFKEFMLNRANSEKVRQINALTVQFNSELEQIVSQKAVDRMREYFIRAKEIVGT